MKIRNKTKGRKSIFTPKGKLALMFLKNYTGLSDEKLIEQINANYQYQFFCDVEITPEDQIENFKIVSDIRVELAKKLKIILSRL